MTALQGLNGHDPKMFASVYADDAIISVAGLNEVNGRAAVEQNMAEWFETFSKAKLGFSRVWVKGHTMVLEWVINGTHHGELFGVKGTEQPIGHYGLSIVHFNNDGKVEREDRYGELGAVMTQVGAAGAKAEAPPHPRGARRARDDPREGRRGEEPRRREDRSSPRSRARRRRTSPPASPTTSSRTASSTSRRRRARRARRSSSRASRPPSPTRSST